MGARRRRFCNGESAPASQFLPHSEPRVTSHDILFAMLSKLFRVVWVIPVFLVACSSNAQQPDRYQGPNDVVAIVGNTSITLAEVDRKAMQQTANGFGSMKLVLAVYEARKNAIDEIAGEKLIDIEAKARGVSSTAL